MYKIEYQNNDNYCSENPNKNVCKLSTHFYINNNCKYCKCSKYIYIGVFEYIFRYIFRLKV
uniref:Uncharacterized protein n=1 Tax=viral metagenome TaxID=1070528 RepID=A0A6C0CX47_9ZZZZ